MSRKEKFKRTSRSKQRRGQTHSAEPGQGIAEPDSSQLPSRRKKFPSSIHKVTKWYYNLLFVLFIGLIVFLFWYGNKFSP